MNKNFIPKVALVHDWLTGMRGGEKVLEALCEILPSADVFTLLHIPQSVSTVIEKHTITTSYLQHFPLIGKKYRYYLPLMPNAIETLDLSAYDVVISTSHCVAKGCIPRKDAIHICYCHTPMRYIWDQFDHYFGPGRSNKLIALAMKMIRPYLQRWDVKTSNRVSQFIANSDYVRQRIQRYYNREAAVIYPPVDTNYYVCDSKNSDSSYYLMVSAFAPYKKLDIAIEAFNQMKLPLKIIGSGQDEMKLKSMAKGTIEFLGWKDNQDLRHHYQNCKALIFPGIEDFGIVPVEAMACGKPIIAFQRGGALETIIENQTGIFFDTQTPDSLIKAVRKSEAHPWDPDLIRNHAVKFSKERFKNQIQEYLKKALKSEFDLFAHIS